MSDRLPSKYTLRAARRGALLLVLLVLPFSSALAGEEPCWRQLIPFYDYPQVRVEAEIELIAETDRFREFSVAFPSAFVSPYPENNTVSCWYWLPKSSEPVPAVVLLHSWGAKKASMPKALGRDLADHGIAALAVTLPYHMRRTPPGYASGKLMVTGDPLEVRAAVRQAVVDVRRAADWLGQQPQLSGKLGIAGISLGAIVGDLVMGVDRRFSADVSMLGAGDVAQVYWRSPLLWSRKWRAEGRGVTYAQVKETFRPIEPTVFAPRVEPDQVLMINARDDFVLPRHSVLALWHAFGRPRVLWVDAGHYGAFLARRQIFQDAARFLEARLLGPSGPVSLIQPEVPVRVRVGLFGIEDHAATLGLSLGIAPRGPVSLEILLTAAEPLVSVSVSPRSNFSVGWGLPLRGGQPRAYVGVFATL